MAALSPTTYDTLVARSAERPSTTGIALLTVMMVVPRSYLVIKLVLIGIFLCANLFSFAYSSRDKPVGGNKPIFAFYLIVALLGICWSAIGAAHGGDPAALEDYLRLYVAWSAAYCVILVFLRGAGGLQVFHVAAILSGIVISLINLAGLYNYYYGIGAIPPAIIEELDLHVGLHEGYIQITSQNIGSLFFVCGYLIASQCRIGRRDTHQRLAQISLALSLLTVVASGRRALWLVVLIVPLLIAGLSIWTRSWRENRYLREIFLGGIILALGLSVFIIDRYGEATVEFLYNAFSAQDERSIQRGYLLLGFLEFPVLGSGFGLNAGYIRSITAPWLYELSYHQMLFNFGIVGASVIGLTAVVYLRLAVDASRRPELRGSGAFEMIIGLLAFLIGVYSNPYLGSFDFLLFLAILPLLASYSVNPPRAARER